MSHQEHKEFNTLHVASTITGIAVCEMTFGEMQVVQDWLCGFATFTHELMHGPTRELVITEGYDQFPNLPTPDEAKADHNAAAAKALAAYGPTISVRKGTHERQESPIDTARAAMPNANIITFEVPGNGRKH